MLDVQIQKDKRGMQIDLVGVTKVRLPLFIPTKKGDLQQVDSTINFFTNLSHDIKGTHMSRFIEAIYEKNDQPMTFQQLKLIASKLKKRLEANKSYLEINFDYFMKKQSPISKNNSYICYECSIQTEVNCKEYYQKLTIKVPVMLLCPCSKSISKYNAHNQKATVIVSVELKKPLFIEDLVNLIEKEASCELYSLLKRPDEKYVTEKSYNNPKFVEDIVRDVALKLRKNPEIKSLSVECESFESIHPHNAYAKLSINENNK